MIEPASLDALRAVCGPGTMIRPEAGSPSYQQDWSGDFVGRAAAVLRPRTTAEVALIVGFCHAAGIRMVAQGGHTGLVGGAAPDGSGEEVVISLERMAAVRAIDTLGLTMEVEAGCVLEAAKAAALAQGCFFPLALGAQGSCHIGGNIGTNAGGLNVLRYGMMRDLVLGLEVVLPDGRVWNGLGSLRKDNTGYDLKQLFIGSEGTLGIVTAAVLKLFPAPEQVETAFLATASVADAVRLYTLARRACSDLLSAFELIPRACVDLALGHQPELTDPLSEPHGVYVLMEASASGYVELRPAVERFLATAMEEGLVVDGTLAANSSQAGQLWQIREAMNEAQRRRGVHLRTDVSLPLGHIAEFIDAAEGAVVRIAEGALAISYGHIGDGNVHLNVLPPIELDGAQRDRMLAACEHAVFDLVDRLGGSISAEHGIGRLKREAFAARISPVHQDLLRGLKALFDPADLMAPGRLVPALEPARAADR